MLKLFEDFFDGDNYEDDYISSDIDKNVIFYQFYVLKQLKIFHYISDGGFAHEKIGNLHDELSELFDKLSEVILYMTKGFNNLQDPFKDKPLLDYNLEDVILFIDESIIKPYTDFKHSEEYKNNGSFGAIIDEITIVCERTIYLLSRNL